LSCRWAIAQSTSSPDPSHAAISDREGSLNPQDPRPEFADRPATETQDALTPYYHDPIASRWSHLTKCLQWLEFTHGSDGSASGNCYKQAQLAKNKADIKGTGLAKG
jgi:hypothetical protein